DEEERYAVPEQDAREMAGEAQQIHHVIPRCIASAAKRRPVASSASASCTVPGSPLSPWREPRSKASATNRAISRKPIRDSRKAATATSLAALRIFVRSEE